MAGFNRHWWAPPGMDSSYAQDDDYGEYLPGEDKIACTYDSAEEAEEAVLREIFGE